MNGSMKKAWWQSSVVYQIYPRSFCDSNGDGIGDIGGIITKLDYLKTLGIDVIWLSPIYKSPNADNGYDISDYQDIMDEFGTMEDFDTLLAEAHKRGLKLVMDLVVNHTSDEHPWFVESISSKDNEKRDYYIWRDPVDGHAPSNWVSAFSGPAWEFDEASGQYYLHLFHKKQPDLDWTNPKVRSSVFDMMNWWCEKGIDGFRMDVISLISKPDGFPDAKLKDGLFGDWSFTANGPHVHEYLKEMRQDVLDRYDLVTVGETAGVTLDEAKHYANLDGSELNMVFQFEHMGLDDGDGMRWSTKKMPLVPLKKNLSKWQTGLDGCAWNSLYFCNHDQPRIVSRMGSEKEELRERGAKCIATSLHMMQGTPYVYEGEELGMTNYPFTSEEEFLDVKSINAFEELRALDRYSEEELIAMIGHKSRDNARTPMQWDDTENAGFTTGIPWARINPNYKEVNAKEQMGRADSVFHYYQKLIRLRHESELVVYGHYELLLPDDPDLFIYRRYLDDGQELLTVCNLSEHNREYKLPEEYRHGTVLIQNMEEHDISDGQLSPFEAYVIQK